MNKVVWIYLTTNLVNNRMYIGKHKSDHYDPTYYGSGKILLQAIDKYGLENFKNEILYEANTLEELNEKEKYFISLYRKKYGNIMYNIANGGDGGDTYSNKPEKEKEDFAKLMKNINQERCSSDDFKEKISRANKERYSDKNEREKQSKRVRAAWDNKELKMKQSQKIKEYYQNHKKDNSYLNIPCIFKLNEVIKEFENIKSLKRFLADEYGYKPDNPRLKQLLTDGSQGIPFTSFFKSKHTELNGMLIYYKQNENVETMGDECNPVGREIGTRSKCKTEIEEIVHSA